MSPEENIDEVGETNQKFSPLEILTESTRKEDPVIGDDITQENDIITDKKNGSIMVKEISRERRGKDVDDIEDEK
ncbi:hypothetical protein DY000_02035604 [Brassica cretica]|uniref:Translocon at the inner envelope membrane of chloroplasts 214 n=1 Tax=Brassica cretica TaxID=69181 RepID=A0ABQ7DVG3_BRACR|nr:hypothetical protein DY000_02035604 [Brassica cretica]